MGAVKTPREPGACHSLSLNGPTLSIFLFPPCRTFLCWSAVLSPVFWSSEKEDCGELGLLYLGVTSHLVFHAWWFLPLYLDCWISHIIVNKHALMAQNYWVPVNLSNDTRFYIICAGGQLKIFFICSISFSFSIFFPFLLLLQPVVLLDTSILFTVDDDQAITSQLLK